MQGRLLACDREHYLCQDREACALEDGLWMHICYAYRTHIVYNKYVARVAMKVIHVLISKCTDEMFLDIR